MGTVLFRVKGGAVMDVVADDPTIVVLLDDGDDGRGPGYYPVKVEPAEVLQAALDEADANMPDAPPHSPMSGGRH